MNPDYHDEAIILYDTDAEMAVIGGVIIDNRYAMILDYLEPDDFHDIRNQKIWEAIKKLARNNNAIDYITLSNSLSGKVEDSYLTKILARSPIGGYESHAKIVADLAYRRRVWLNSSKLINEIINNREVNPEDLVIEFMGELNRSSGDVVHVNAITDEVMDDVYRHKDERVRLYTGMQKFDEATNGFDVGELIYLDGEPGVGKSMLSTQWAYNISKDYPVVYYSIEMGQMQLTKRILSMISNVDIRNFENMSESDSAKFMEAVGELETRKLYIREGSMTIGELISDVHRQAKTLGVKFAVVDYFYLLGGYEKMKMTERTERMSRDLKLCTRSAKVCLLVITSLTKEGGRQSLGSYGGMRGSGQMEYDADYRMSLKKSDAVDKSVRRLYISKGRNMVQDHVGLDLIKSDTIPKFMETRTREVHLNGDNYVDPDTTYESKSNRW